MRLACHNQTKWTSSGMAMSFSACLWPKQLLRATACMILTSCHTHTVQCLQIALPCCHCRANQTNAEWCLEFTTRGGYQMFHGLSGSDLPPS